MKQIEIAVPVGQTPSIDEIQRQGCRVLGIGAKNFGGHRIVKRSLDARGDVLWRYRVDVWAKGETVDNFTLPPYRDVHEAQPVVIVGSGPAGMFAALELISRGIKPIILERGKDVHSRKRDIASLSTKGIVNPDSNYCFGEGGAGTFSDGKLYTRSTKRGDIRIILHRLVEAGADPNILIETHAHIGSDRLPQIVENIRQRIISFGGEYHFDCRVEDIIPTADFSNYTLVTAGGARFTSRKVILCTGHSSREMYYLFKSKGWALEAKGFALGVRVEHPQSLINNIQYHGHYQPYMPAAEYSFATQVKERGVFSFCMCPGGILVPSASAPGELVLNGMSNSGRTGKWANAGVVVSVEPQDLPQWCERYGILGPLEYQRATERSMFEARESQQAPAQRMMDFCRGILSQNLPKTSYHPGVWSAPLNEMLPENIASRLRLAFPYVGNKLMHHYYTNDALVLGVESRTSSPVRILRNPETMQSVSAPGIYPAGEGAGYSGGIVSSALDGTLCAAALAQSI